jgi:hypothetical protein
LLIALALLAGLAVWRPAGPSDSATGAADRHLRSPSQIAIARKIA